MKKLMAYALVILIGLSLLTGCSSKFSSVRIDLSKSLYSIREDTTLPISASQTLSGTEKVVLDGYLKALLASIEQVPAQVYVFNFSGIGDIESEKVRAHLLPALRDSLGENHVLERSQMEHRGVWVIPEDGTALNNIQEIWISSYQNADQELEYVLDFSRNNQPLRTIRFVDTKNGTLRLKENTLLPNYDGQEPTEYALSIPDKVSSSDPMYLKGQLHRTGIFEQPVLSGLDFLMKIQGKPVPGALPGGFAGAFEGTVTIDGQTFPLTLDGNSMAIPTGLISNPAEYYIAFSEIGIANAQDTTAYRNVYFIKTDLSSVFGLYSFHKKAVISDWFETSVVSADSYHLAVTENNDRLTALYSDVIVQTYANRKEYNNTLAVIYNMFIGVDHKYLKTNLKKNIATVSKDIRDYAEAYQDPSVSRLGENGIYFFPNGRSMLVRLLSYDGENAIAAIDFSSKLDQGYGALYKAHYEDGKWTLTTLLNTRIK